MDQIDWAIILIGLGGMIATAGAAWGAIELAGRWQRRKWRRLIRRQGKRLGVK